MPVFDPRRRQYQVLRIITQRYHVVFLLLLELKRLNHVLDLHRKQVHDKHLVVQRHNNLVLPDTYWLYARLKRQIRHNSLRIYQQFYYR
jgi:hypothetical protein